MDLRDCTRFANENPICYLATVDGDQPRVRGMMIWYADDTGFYFHSGYPKAVCRQLLKNPKAEVCFFVPGPDGEEGGGTMLRVAGEVEFLQDRAIRERVLEERPFLKQMVSGPDDPALAIFRIVRGEAHFWTLENEMRGVQPEQIRF